MTFRSTGPPRLGASSEKLDQCPYDPCHWIRPTKLDDHVIKCRLNHREDLAEKGQCPMLLTCQYNYLHKVIDIEWRFHSARCPDRKKIWSYQLRTGDLKKLYPEMLAVSGEDIQPEKGERLEMYGGLNEGRIWCSELKRNLKLKDIGKDANDLAQEDAEEKGKALAEEVENEWKGGKVAPNPPPPPPPPPSFQVKYTQEEIDFWNAPGTPGKKPFSWMLHNINPQGYVPNYPPGLTKKQRREFEIKNSKEFEKKMAANKKAEAAKEEQDLGKEALHSDSEEVEETFEEKAEEGRTQF